MRQTVLIIGASGEIGRGIVQELSTGPYQFILHYHQNEKAIEQLRDILDEDQLLMSIQSDLSKFDTEDVLNTIPFQIDIIIFAQGQAVYGMFTETDLHQLDQLYATHVRSTIGIAQTYIQDMINRQNGHIIVISSIWGEIGASHEVHYSTVKGAQLSFVKALAKEVGQSNVKVNAVSPGMIQTNMNEHLSHEDVNDYLTNIPLGKVGSVRDVAKTVSFLCSEDSSYIHGQIIRVNGGQLT